MLKWYAETFKLSGRQLTSAALGRIKWLTILSLPAMPLAITRVFVEIPNQFELPIHVFFLLSLAAFVCLCCTKFVNRFWARDRYLDEWERARKHQAMAFAFQVMVYSFSIILAFGVLSETFSVFQNVAIRNLDAYEIGVVAAGVLAFGFYVMHFYLLLTVKPIDEGEKDDALLETA